MKHKQLTHSSAWQYVKSSTRCNGLIRETNTPCLVVIVLQKVSMLLCASALQFLLISHHNLSCWVTTAIPPSANYKTEQSLFRLCDDYSFKSRKKINSSDCCPAIKDTCWIWALSRKAPSHRQVAAVLWGTCPLVGCDRRSNTAGKMQRLLEPNLNPINTQ